jgi:FkbM family methyltransferase
MKNIFVKTGSPLRKFFPLVQRLRGWAWKFHNRMGLRLVISGGKVRFMDTELDFAENVGLNYATPLFWNGPDAYEAATSHAIALLAGRSKLFLDIGSNVGIYSVYVGVKYPQVRTIAFEPVPAIWAKNCAFHRANNLSEASVQNLALSDRNGVQKMFIPVYVNAVEEEQVATLRADSWQVHEEKVETFEVECVTLDSFAQTTPLPDGLCALKIDVENFEAAVLRGAKKFIGTRRPWIICEILPCEEFDPATKTKRINNRETVELIKELGYTPFAITDQGLFRMTAQDFTRPRGLKDFLLAPTEKVPDDTYYLALASLAELLPQS